jgi:hypothetical protein
MRQEKIEKIEWTAPEYIFRQKSPDWFWGLGIITITGFIVSLLLNNFLLSTIILLAGFAVALQASRRPNIIYFSVGPTGVQIDKTIYPYENLKSFWINYQPPAKKELIIESKKVIMPQIVILLGDADPIKVRNCLIKFLKEERIEESLIDTLFRFLGF